MDYIETAQLSTLFIVGDQELIDPDSRNGDEHAGDQIDDIMPAHEDSCHIHTYEPRDEDDIHPAVKTRDRQYKEKEMCRVKAWERRHAVMWSHGKCRRVVDYRKMSAPEQIVVFIWNVGKEVVRIKEWAQSRQ